MIEIQPCMTGMMGVMVEAIHPTYLMVTLMMITKSDEIVAMRVKRSNGGSRVCMPTRKMHSWGLEFIHVSPAFHNWKELSYCREHEPEKFKPLRVTTNDHDIYSATPQNLITYDSVIQEIALLFIT